MTETEFVDALHLPTEPCTSAELLQRLRASGDWRVDRIMGSAGEVAVEVTHRPLRCRGRILCKHLAGDQYTIRGIGPDRVAIGVTCDTDVSLTQDACLEGAVRSGEAAAALFSP